MHVHTLPNGAALAGSFHSWMNGGIGGEIAMGKVLLGIKAPEVQNGLTVLGNDGESKNREQVYYFE